MILSAYFSLYIFCRFFSLSRSVWPRCRVWKLWSMNTTCSRRSWTRGWESATQSIWTCWRLSVKRAKRRVTLTGKETLNCPSSGLNSGYMSEYISHLHSSHREWSSCRRPWGKSSFTCSCLNWSEIKTITARASILYSAFLLRLLFFTSWRRTLVMMLSRYVTSGAKPGDTIFCRWNYKKKRLHPAHKTSFSVQKYFVMFLH